MSSQGPDELDRIRDELVTALAPILGGTSYAPTEGVLTEAIVLCVWLQPDGAKGLTYVPATVHSWSTLGILEHAYYAHQRGVVGLDHSD